MTMQAVVSYVDKQGPGYLLVSDAWTGMRLSDKAIALGMPVEKHFSGPNFLGMLRSSRLRRNEYESCVEQIQGRISSLNSLFVDLHEGATYPQLNPDDEYDLLIAKQLAGGLELYAMSHSNGSQNVLRLHSQSVSLHSSELWLAPGSKELIYCPTRSMLDLDQAAIMAVRSLNALVPCMQEIVKLDDPYDPLRFDIYTLDGAGVRKRACINASSVNKKSATMLSK